MPIVKAIEPKKVNLYKGNTFYEVPHYWFVIKGANGKTLATSETYTRKASAIKTARQFGTVIDLTGEKK